MRTITRKEEIQTEWEACKKAFNPENLDLFINIVYERVLLHKVKFPLLEYCAEDIYKLLPSEIQIYFCDAIEKLKTEGGNVILGKILQLRLAQHPTLQPIVEKQLNTFLKQIFGMYATLLEKGCSDMPYYIIRIKCFLNTRSFLRTH